MEQLNYGGQAVIEGVMMRGNRAWAAAVRAPSGEIVVHQESLPGGYQHPFLKLPFLRGLISLWDALGLGMRALLWSSDIALGEDTRTRMAGPVAWGTVAFSLALGVGLFFLLPMFLVSLLDPFIASDFASNVFEGIIRLAIFVLYIAAIGLMPDIRRVYAYHGAEHKTINAYEAGAPLTVEAVAGYSRLHVRCGTGFMLLVLVIFIALSTLIGRPPLALRLLSRLVLIPVVTGIAYEIIKWAARLYPTTPWVRAIMAPGLALQALTTREPSLEMLQVALTALDTLLSAEGLKKEASERPQAFVEEKAPMPLHHMPN